MILIDYVPLPRFTDVARIFRGGMRDDFPTGVGGGRYVANDCKSINFSLFFSLLSFLGKQNHICVIKRKMYESQRRQKTQPFLLCYRVQ